MKAGVSIHLSKTIVTLNINLLKYKIVAGGSTRIQKRWFKVKRTVFIALLLCFTFTVIIGCGGGGGGGGNQVATDPADTPPAAGATTSKALGASGGDVPLGNFNLSIPAGTLTDDTTVTVTSLGSNVTLDTTGTLVGSAIHVDYGESDQQTPKVRKLSEIFSAPTISFNVSQEDNLLILRKGTLTFGEEILTDFEYPAFSEITANNASGSKTISVVDNLFPFCDNATFAVLSLDTQYSNVPDPQLSSIESANKRKNVGNLSINDNINIVLIHGWDPDERTGDMFPYKIGMWDTFINEFNNTTLENLQENVSLYYFTYPTYKSVSENRLALAQAIEDFSSSNTFLVCHSMGGLVARHALTQEDVASKVKKVITLATPHHGAILASFKYVLDRTSQQFSSIELRVIARLLVIFFSEHYNANNAGFRNLCWDNFDGSINTSAQALGMVVNEGLSNFNNTTTHDGKIISFAGEYRELFTSKYGIGYSIMQSSDFISLIPATDTT